MLSKWEIPHRLLPQNAMLVGILSNTILSIDPDGCPFYVRQSDASEKWQKRVLIKVLLVLFCDWSVKEVPTYYVLFFSKPIISG